MFVGDKQTHRQTPIYSLVRDKLSLPRELVYPFKQGIQVNVEKFKDTTYASELVPSIIAHTDQKKLKILMDAIANSRKFLKNTAQQIYEDEVKKRCYESLTQAGAENLMIFGNNFKDIFRFYKELHDMDWRAMMRETSPIFLSPAILNRIWISQVRKKVEHTLNISIVKDMNYDGERCYDFAHTILQKHVKDLATKLYKRYLHRFGIKLLTKMPKMESVQLMVEKFASIMLHATFDANLKTTHVYCILSQEADSNHEDTTIDINKIECVTCEVGVKVVGKWW